MSRGRPRQFDRDEAVHRAKAVFWEHGYQDASISRLTDAMGIGSPSLYAAFGSKADLFCEAAERYEADDAARPLEAFDRGASARDGMHRMLLSYIDLFTGHGARGCLLTRAASVTPADEPVAQYLARSAKERVRSIECRLADAAVRGEVIPGGRPRDLAEFYDTVVQGLAVKAGEGAPKASLRRAADLAMAGWPVT